MRALLCLFVVGILSTQEARAGDLSFALRNSSAAAALSHDPIGDLLESNVETVADLAIPPSAAPRRTDWSGESWTLTGAYRVRVKGGAQLSLEALRSQGPRKGLDPVGLQPRQRRTLVQSSLRMSF